MNTKTAQHTPTALETVQRQRDEIRAERDAYAAEAEALRLALIKLTDAVETRKPEHEGYLVMCAQEARATLKATA